MVDKALFSSAKEDWGTPEKFFQLLDEQYNFTIDLAASADNTKCPRFFCKEDDALKQTWEGERGWLNPPYGRGIILPWVKKAYLETRLSRKTWVVMLLPARTDNAWFKIVKNHAREYHFIPGRLKFGCAKHTPPFESLLAIFGPPMPWESASISPVAENLSDFLSNEPDE